MRTKIILGSAVAIVMAVSGVFFAMTHANKVSAFDAATSAIRDADALAVKAAAEQPQAAYLWVTRWNTAQATELVQITNIASAPESLIDAQASAELLLRVEALKPQFAKGSEAAPAKADVALHDQIAAQLEDNRATFGAEGDAEPHSGSQGTRVTTEAVRALEAEAARAAERAEAARAGLLKYETKLDALDAQAAETAELLIRSAQSGVDRGEEFARERGQASPEAHSNFAESMDDLGVAIRGYEGDASRADADADADTDAEAPRAGAKPPQEARLSFTHPTTELVPSAAVSRGLLSALDAYVRAAKELAASHDAAVAAQQLAEAGAVANTGSGAWGTGPETGDWAQESGAWSGVADWSAGPGGNVGDGGSGDSAGDGWAPPVAGGGSAGTGDTGGGDTAYVPPTGGGGGFVPPVGGNVGAGCPDGQIATSWDANGPHCEPAGW